MPDEIVEILLVEDNPSDAELTLRALARHHLANKVLVVSDGAEALDYLFATGSYAGRANAVLRLRLRACGRKVPFEWAGSSPHKVTWPADK